MKRNVFKKLSVIVSLIFVLTVINNKVIAIRPKEEEIKTKITETNHKGAKNKDYNNAKGYSRKLTMRQKIVN